MFKKIISNLGNIIIIYCVLYILLFVFFQFYTPDLGDLNVKVIDSKSPDGLKEITISNPNSSKESYLIVYQESKENNWMYYAPKTYSKSTDYLASKFIPENINKYIILESMEYENSFTFGVKPRYPISYMANKEHKFSVFYIVPYNFFIFPTFYYTTHFVFFLDPII